MGYQKVHRYEFIFSVSQTQNYYDFVTIFDGANDLSTQIGDKLSGSLDSFNISSTGNYLLVKFKSNNLGGWSGFLATIHQGTYHISKV